MNTYLLLIYRYKSMYKKSQEYLVQKIHEIKYLIQKTKYVQRKIIRNNTTAYIECNTIVFSFLLPYLLICIFALVFGRRVSLRLFVLPQMKHHVEILRFRHLCVRHASQRCFCDVVSSFHRKIRRLTPLPI